MWEFYDSFGQDDLWTVTNGGAESFTLHYRDEALTLCSLLNEHELKQMATIYSPSITRLEIIDDEGRQFVRWNTKIELVSYQDDNRTVKIFITNKEK